jgi:hypothetical protein
VNGFWDRLSNLRKYTNRSIEEIEMSAIQPTLQTIVGHISQFRKITPTLATFRVNGIACKAEHHAIPYVERWSKSADCVYEFQGAYQQSRFGREFVTKHGRPEALAASSISPRNNQDVEAIMRTIGGAPTQLEAAPALSATETIPAEVQLGRGNDSSLTGKIAQTEALAAVKRPEQTRPPSREERLEPLIQQTMKTYRDYFSSKELKKSLNSGSPIAREAARRVLAEREQSDDTTIAA